LQADRGHPHDIDRRVLLFQLGEKVVDPLGVNLAPAIAAKIVKALLIPKLLTVVDAEHDDEGRRPLVRDDVSGLCHPVVEILTHVARRSTHLLDHRDFRMLGEEGFGEPLRQLLGEPLRQLLGHGVADDDDIFLRRLLPLDVGICCGCGIIDRLPADLRARAAARASPALPAASADRTAARRS